MTEQPLISVVVPAYNCEKYLERALGSALDQSWTNIEIIVIDDGSTDGTAEQAAKFGDKINYVSQSNAGASSARNKGIQLAKGEYIAFLDADDSWVPTKLELQMEVFRRHPEVVMVCTRSLHLNEELESEHNALESPAFDPDAVQLEDFKNLFENPYLATSTVMVSTEVAREVGGFDTGLVTAEDLDFYFNCCWHRGFSRLNQQLVYKAEVEGSLGGGPRTYSDNMFVINRFIERHEEFRRDYSSSIQRQKLYIYTRWINYLLYHGDGKQARVVLNEASDLPIENTALLRFKSYFSPLIATLKRR